MTEALGHGADGIRPGLLVAPEDAAALGAALRAWLGDAELRGRLRRAARERRESLPAWSTTASVVAGVLAGGVAMTARGHPGQRGMARPARARRRRGPRPRPRRATSGARSRRPGRQVIHDLGGGTGAMGRWLAPLLPGPQHWIVHDRDADLLAIAAADRPGPAADGAAVTVEARHSDITRLHRGRSRRRDPDHRLGAAGPADRGRAGRAGHGVCAGAGCPVLLTLSVVGRVEPDPGGPAGRARGRRIRCPPAPRRPSGAACSAPTPSRSPSRSSAGWAPRSSSGPARGASAPCRPSWRRSGSPGGWVPRASSSRAGRRDRRLHPPTSGAGERRTARGHRGPRRPAGPALSRALHRSVARNRGESA